MIKVLLCNPPSINNDKIIREGRCTQKSSFWSLNYPPLTLAQLTAILRRVTNTIVETHDFGTGVNFQESFQKINIVPDYAVINIGSTQFDVDIDYCRELTERFSCKIIVMGTHVSSFAQEILAKYEFIDYVCLNEPEFIISSFFKDVSNESMLFSRTNSKVVNDFSHSIEDLPEPDWSSFELSNYKLPSTGEKFLMINPTRGCPWKCSFCTAPNFYGNKLRSRSIKQIVAEIKTIKERYGIKNFLMWSDTFTANKKFVKELCAEIKKLNIRWVSNSRVDTLNYETAKVMKESGCWLLTFGIETHNDKTLEKISKGYKEADIEKGVNAAKDAGILTVGHYILGLPGESSEDMRRTYTKSKELGLDYSQFYYATPFPGTRIYSELAAFNDLSPFDNYTQDKCYFNGVTSIEELRELKNEFSLKSLFRVETFNFVGRSFTFRQIVKSVFQLRSHLKI